MTMFFELTSSTWNINYSTTLLLLSKISFYTNNTRYTLVVYRLFDVNSEAANMITLKIDLSDPFLYLFAQTADQNYASMRPQSRGFVK
jgi:hypothetical protein